MNIWNKSMYKKEKVGRLYKTFFLPEFHRISHKLTRIWFYIHRKDEQQKNTSLTQTSARTTTKKRTQTAMREQHFHRRTLAVSYFIKSYYKVPPSTPHPATSWKSLSRAKNNHVNTHHYTDTQKDFNKCHVTAVTIEFNGPERGV